MIYLRFSIYKVLVVNAYLQTADKGYGNKIADALSQQLTTRYGAGYSHRLSITLCYQWFGQFLYQKTYIKPNNHRYLFI